MKGLMLVLPLVAEKYLNMDSDYDCLVLHALKASQKIDLLLRETKTDFVLSPRKSEELEQVIQHFNTTVAELGRRSHGQGLRLWNWTIKNHCLFHLPEQGRNLHPCLVWNYTQEGFLLHVRTLVQACRNRKSACKITAGVMQRWCTGVEIGLQHNWLV